MAFAPPPSPDLHPFAVPSPEYVDPLESLAKLRQNRVQNMQVQQAQLKMQSQKAMMQAFAQAGRDPDKLWQIASSRGDILPEDLVALQNHMLETRTKLATLTDQEQKQVDHDTERYAALMNGVTTRDGVAAANARAAKMNLFRSKQFDPIDPATLDEDTLADSLTAHVNSYLTLGEMTKRMQAQAQLAQTQAATGASEQSAATSRLAGEKTTQEIAKGRREQMVEAVRSAPLDPMTGTPTPAAWKQILVEFKDQKLPEEPTKDYIDRLVKSAIAPKDIPDYEIKEQMLKAGMTGTTQWDQFLFQNAKALNKTPKELTPKEYNEIATKYKELEQSPIMAALGETNKRLQNQVLQTQVAGFLTPEQIEANARELLSGDMAPDQIKELRPGGRVNQGGQIIQRARELAKAEGKPFSFLELEMAADQRQKTLAEFNSTLISHAGGQRLALSTLIHHADLYLDAAAALKNGTFKPGNEVYNRVASMFGSAPPTNAKLLAQFFASETGKVATGGVPAEGEIRGILGNMSTDGSPQAMEGAGKTLIGIAAGRMIPLKELRDKARLQKFVDILGSDAQEILKRRGFNPETMKPMVAIPLKSGRTAYANTQQEANEFKRKNPTLVK